MNSTPFNQNGDCVHNPFEQLSSDKVDNEDANVEHIVSDDDELENYIAPRIGDEYQSELPPPIGEPNLEDAARFMIGLPIPVTQMKCGKHKHQDYNNVVEIRKCCTEGYVLVPGLPDASWSDAEKASFLLALYIFEKNFVEVRRFVETKDMGALLAFYYGSDFYLSRGYLRWCEGRKSSKKSVHGQKIFSGLRQQELLSRLIQKVPEECKRAVIEVFTMFGENKTSFTDYIFTLKALVGTSTLVEAIGVGKGKQDITRMLLEPPKPNQMTQTRSEIPAGKACSSLTTTEIAKFLSGNYRLSKARSNDLFWEAVWPRLLARGWHSEQPDNQRYIGGSKLVFLTPGVKKFSRRKLVKGGDYFDSVADVLSKVGKDPELIELEADESESNKKDESNIIKLEKNDQPENQRHYYLQPKLPNRSLDAVKFMIVDTSLSDGNFRELRTLPSQIPDMFISHCLLEDDKSGNTTIRVDGSASETIQTCKSGGKSKVLKNKGFGNNDATLLAAKSGGKSSVLNKEVKVRKKPQKITKILSRKPKLGSADNIAPMSKCCKRLTAEETRDDMIDPSPAPALENGMSHCSSDAHEINRNNMLASNTSSRGSPCESNDPHQPPLLIDLNWPTPEFENDQCATTTTNLPDEQQPTKKEAQPLPSSEARNEEQQTVMNPRRLSTRYRPPTTRTLEAVANGFLSVTRKRKGKDVISSRPSQRARISVGPTESPVSSVASQVEEAEREESSNPLEENSGLRSKQ